MLNRWTLVHRDGGGAEGGPRHVLFAGDVSGLDIGDGGQDWPPARGGRGAATSCRLPFLIGRAEICRVGASLPLCSASARNAPSGTSGRPRRLHWLRGSRHRLGGGRSGSPTGMPRQASTGRVPGWPAGGASAASHSMAAEASSSVRCGVTGQTPKGSLRPRSDLPTTIGPVRRGVAARSTPRRQSQPEASGSLGAALAGSAPG